MTITKVAASLAALTILAASPALAHDEPARTTPAAVALASAAAPTTLPIRLLDVALLPPAGGPETGGGIVSIAFENTAPMPATDVLFEVSGAHGFTRIHDRGTFSPNVRIRHVFPAFELQFDESVRVRAMRFADGRVVTDDDEPLRARRQASGDDLFDDPQT